MSMSLDLSPMFNYAAQLFNGLSPVIVIIGGVTFGAALVVFLTTFVLQIADGRRTMWRQ